MAGYTARALVEFNITPLRFIEMPANEQAFIMATIAIMDEQAAKEAKKNGC